MAGKRTRKPRTINGRLAGVVYDAMGNVTGVDDSTIAQSSAWQPTADPDIVKKQVPTGTAGATADGATSVSVGFPDPGSDTWYKPSDGAYMAGRAQAAIDTIQQTAGQLATIGSTIGNNLVPIVIGRSVVCTH